MSVPAVCRDCAGCVPRLCRRSDCSRPRAQALVPVIAAARAQPGRIEDRGQGDDRAAAHILRDLELQPRTPGHLHLGAEAQQPILLERLHAPEVDRVADLDPDRVAPAAAQPRATSKHVEQSAQSPEPGALVPPGLAADALNRPRTRAQAAPPPAASASPRDEIHCVRRRTRPPPRTPRPTIWSRRSHDPRRRAHGRSPHRHRAAARETQQAHVGRERLSRCEASRRACGRPPRTRA